MTYEQPPTLFDDAVHENGNTYGSQGEWKKRPLGDCVTLRSGSTPRRSDDENWGGDIPWISAKSLHRFLIHDAKEYVTETGASKARVVTKNTILVLVRGMRLAKEFPVGITQCPVTFNQDVKALTPKNGIRPLYLAYALKGQEQRAMNWASKTTHGTLRLTTPQLKEIPIPVPSPEEQDRIAEILSTWDRAIEQVNALIEQKQERLHGLRQRLLTGEQRFPEFDEPWQEKELGDYFRYFSNRNSDERDHPVLSCSKVHGIIPQSEKFDRRVASKDTSNYKIVERGDLVYDPMLLWDASIGFVDCVDRGLVSPAYYTFKFNEERGCRDFFRHLLATHRVRYRYKAISQGTNQRRRKAPRGAFLGIGVDVPSLPEQQKIASVMQTAEAEIERLEKKRDALKSQKKGLMQRLLTGAVRTV